MRALAAASVAFVLLLSGCTHAYKVRIQGDVEGTDKDTPRAVRSDVLEGTEVDPARQAGLGHLKPLTDAEVTVSLRMKGEDQPRASDTYKVDSRTAEFSMRKEGEGQLASVVVKVTAPGHKPVEHGFPSPPDIPFEAKLMAVLDEVAPPAQPPTGSGTPAAPGK